MRFHFPAALIAFGLAALPVPAAPARDWSYHEIFLPTSQDTVANAVNQRGEVVGYITHVPPGATATVGEAFRWDNGVTTRLGFPPGANNSNALGINDRGVVVGTWTYNDAIVWRDGAWSSLGFRGEARAINRAGQIVGTYNTWGGVQAFLWMEGSLRNLGTLGGPDSVANAINNRGVIAGSATFPDWNTRHAVIWSGGVLKDIGTLGGPQAEAFDINDRGVAVGASLDRDFGWAAFIYEESSGIRRLFNLPGTHMARAINDRGAVVGTIDDGSFLFEDGVLTRLEEIPAVKAAGAALRPRDINDRGWIVGDTAPRPGRPSRGFVLIPR